MFPAWVFHWNATQLRIGRHFDPALALNRLASRDRVASQGAQKEAPDKRWTDIQGGSPPPPRVSRSNAVMRGALLRDTSS
jgi:hypothetical protein